MKKRMLRRLIRILGVSVILLGIAIANIPESALATEAENKTTVSVDESVADASKVSIVLEKDGPYVFSVKMGTEDGVSGLPSMPAGGARAYFELKLTDSSSTDITDFGKARVTLPIPASVDLDSYKLSKVYTNKDSELEECKNSVANKEAKTISFDTDHFSQFAVEFVPIGGSSSEGGPASDKNIKIKSSLTDSDKIEVNLSPAPSGNYAYTLTVESLSQSGLGDILPNLPKNSIRKHFEITLTDDKNENSAVTGFTSVSLKIPLPSDVDLSKMKLVAIYTKDSEGKLESLTGGSTGTSPVPYVSFKTSHFSEFVIEFTPQESASGNNTTTGTATNATGTGNTNSAGKGQNTSVQKADMPKTADMTNVKSLTVILFIIAGTLMLVLSIPTGERKRAWTGKRY